MKKIALFALAALCVTAAQAVTITWTSTGTYCDKNRLVVYLANGSEAEARQFAAMTYVDLGGGTEKIGDIKLTLNNTPAATTEVIGSHSGDAWGRGYDPTATTGELTVFVGNEYHPPYNSEDWNGVATLVFVDYTSTADQTACHFYELTADQVADLFAGTNVEVNVGVVPEPTALALLALGVAGLALKRKNA